MIILLFYLYLLIILSSEIGIMFVNNFCHQLGKPDLAFTVTVKYSYMAVMKKVIKMLEESVSLAGDVVANNFWYICHNYRKTRLKLLIR